ncbi:terminase large subunit domain-containing protein [Microbacterium sp. MYb72]|uniref:terminase large subunit domain-containing protein n=1 Tax=Microbacterium sp. MYb72 TaxID=1848693 RepID=UPI0015E40324|nr:terminase family protein [Microbacterium sp. MYb72]
MPSPRPTKTSTPTTSERKLSDVAKHLVVPSGIKTTGYPSVEAQCRKMGVAHDPWQKGLGRAILAKRENGLYAAGIGGVLISICRQVGKTFTIGTIIFALCIIFPRIKVLWTAHHSATSDETFETLSSLAKRRRIAPYIRSVRAGNGKQRIVFTNGSRIMFGAREHGFGRGIPGVTIVVFDECQILKAKALSDMIPAANTVKNPLIIYMGTPPKPEDPAEVFKARRKKALAVKKRRAAGETVDFDTLWVEVGADRDDDVEDRNVLAKANPSFPHRTPWEAILRLRENLTDPADWSREGLGIWDEENAVGGPLKKLWPQLAVGADQVPTDGVRAYGVAFSADAMRVSLGGCIIAGERAHTELIDAQQGPVEETLAPLADWFVEEIDGVPRWRRASAIVLSGRAGAIVLERLLIERRVPRRRIIVVTTPQYFQACGLLLEQATAAASAVKRGEQPILTHLASGQVQMDDSADKAVQEKRARDGAWGWASPAGDETPVEAVSLALFGARTGRKKREGSGVIL